MSTPTGSIRRSMIDRVTLGRQVFRPEPPPRMPAWPRNLLLALLLIPLLLLVLLACDESQKPQTLAGSTLVGPRLTTGPVCLEEAVDVSGSMTAYTGQREQAEQALSTFARRELTPEDRLSEAFFASTGMLTLPPTSMASLSAPPGVPAGLEGGGTNLTPAVQELLAARPAADPCAVHALVVITDGLLGDDPAALTTALETGRYDRVFAVIPSATGTDRPAELTGGRLDSVIVYHFHDGGWSGWLASVLHDSKPLDVVFGEIIGSLTGQTLEKMDQPLTPAPSGQAASR